MRKKDASVFTTVLMIEKPLTPADVEMVTTLHGDEQVSFVILMQPRGDQDRLLRAVDDVALGYLDDAARENEVPEGQDAFPPAQRFCCGGAILCRHGWPRMCVWFE